MKTLQDEKMAFHTRNAQPIIISIQESAGTFASACSDVQAIWLMHLAEQIDSWESNQSWAMQCRHITDEIPINKRSNLISVLETLLDHLKE